VEFLEQPTIAFVRLSEGVLMPTLTEVPVPVRFMFVLLGPRNFDLDYHEVGRSISTLMANEHFHSIAYKADDRKDLLSAINVNRSFSKSRHTAKRPTVLINLEHMLYIRIILGKVYFLTNFRIFLKALFLREIAKITHL